MYTGGYLEVRMTHWVLLFVFMLTFLFVLSCGDDGDGDQDPDAPHGGGTDSQTAVDAGGAPGTDTGGAPGTDTGGAPGADTGTSGDLDALAACTSFQQASWDRIRACGSPTAAVLPPNELAESVCASLCEVEGKTVARSEYDTCIAYATTVPCEDISINIAPDAGSNIPAECAFLIEMGCLF